MEEEKKLYPFQFIKLDEIPGEVIHLADLGYLDSLVSRGWLAANSIAEIMDMYMDRVVGQHVFDYYGRQFPVMVKHYDGSVRSPLLVHPDDEIAEQRFDFLGKAKLWYITKVKPGARLYLGFSKDVDAGEFYMACRHSQVEEILNAVEPQPGESYFIYPGLVHAFSEGVEMVEISESSPLDFRLFDWGRVFDGDEFDAELNLDAALDFIDYKKYCGVDSSDCKEFRVTRLDLTDALQINTSNLDCYVLYTCISGKAVVQIEEEDEKGESNMKAYTVGPMETLLVPAEVSEFSLVPAVAGTVLLETVSPFRDAEDKYIDPDVDPQLHDEDNDDLEDESEYRRNILN